jgi:hypothetical protein
MHEAPMTGYIEEGYHSEDFDPDDEEFDTYDDEDTPLVDTDSVANMLGVPRGVVEYLIQDIDRLATELFPADEETLLVDASAVAEMLGVPPEVVDHLTDAINRLAKEFFPADDDPDELSKLWSIFSILLGIEIHYSWARGDQEHNADHLGIEHYLDTERVASILGFSLEELHDVLEYIGSNRGDEPNTVSDADVKVVIEFIELASNSYFFAKGNWNDSWHDPSVIDSGEPADFEDINDDNPSLSIERVASLLQMRPDYSSDAAGLCGSRY